MTPEELVARFFERAYNQKDVEYVMEAFAENYHEHTETGARSNRDAREIIKATSSTFPDLSVEINEILSRDDTVAVRLTFTATHRGAFLGVAATDKAITFEAMEFFRIANGRIAESWGAWPIYDILEMLTD